jgi:hypothetical protein
MISNLKCKFFFLLTLLITSGAVHAEPRAIRDWIVDLTTKYSEAYTYNDSKSLFGLYCTEKCFFYISPKEISCEEGADSVVLVNSKNSAQAVTGVCKKLGDRFIRVFNEFDSIMNSIKDVDNVGFAFAMQDGGFNVSRFGLKGSHSAINQALDNAIKNKSYPKNKNTDSRL